MDSELAARSLISAQQAHAAEDQPIAGTSAAHLHLHTSLQQQKGTTQAEQQAAAASDLDASAASGANSSPNPDSSAASEPPSVLRVLVGHSLGAACAALEALENPKAIAALVLVAPAILSFGNKGMQGAQLVEWTPPSDTNSSSSNTSTSGSSNSSGGGIDVPQSARSDAGGAQSLGTTSTSDSAAGGSPDDVQLDAVTRLVAQRQPPPETDPSKLPGNLKTAGSGAPASAAPVFFASRAFRSVMALLQALSIAAVVLALRLLSPLIVRLLRLLVRSRVFWENGLKAAYHDRSLVSSAMVDAYRLPQAVRGWEAGMVNFLLARFSYAASLRKVPSGCRSVLAASIVLCMWGLIFLIFCFY